MTAFQYISEHVNVKLKPSRLNGVGVFALKDIKAGSHLFLPWPGETDSYSITQSQLDQLSDNVRAHVYDMFEFKNYNGFWEFRVDLVNDCYWIFKSPYHWVNSCSWDSEPNVDLKQGIALRNIRSGQELLTKYGKYNKVEKSRAI